MPFAGQRDYADFAAWPATGRRKHVSPPKWVRSAKMTPRSPIPDRRRAEGKRFDLPKVTPCSFLGMVGFDREKNWPPFLPSAPVDAPGLMCSRTSGFPRRARR